MGIRFHCPQGHKLNVKEFLAGKRAVCPKCGEKVLVPMQSEPAATAAGPAEPEVMPTGEPAQDVATTMAQPARAVGPIDVALAAATSPVPAEAASPQVAAVPVTAAPVAAAPIAAAPVSAAPVTVTAAPAQTAAPAMVAPALAAAAVVDPISEAPTAVWYVRPPSGGQFGPAAGDIMRGWLAEGRVTADSLVWRAGWPEWRSAAAAFPQLSGGIMAGMAPQGVVAGAVAPGVAAPMVTPMGAPVQVAPVQMAPVMAAPVVPTGVPVGQISSGPMYGEPITGGYEDPVSRVRRRRQKGANATVIVSGILIALVVILFIILGVVLSQQGVEEPESAPRPKARSSTKEKSANSSKPAVEVSPLEDA